MQLIIPMSQVRGSSLTTVKNSKKILKSKIKNPVEEGMREPTKRLRNMPRNNAIVAITINSIMNAAYNCRKLAPRARSIATSDRRPLRKMLVANVVRKIERIMNNTRDIGVDQLMTNVAKTKSHISHTAITVKKNNFFKRNALDLYQAGDR